MEILETLPGFIIFIIVLLAWFGVFALLVTRRLL